MKPYTYLIKHIPTSVYYYGCRYSKDCDPNDLWKTYFTSSKEVKKLIEVYGKESFDIQIRKVFADVNACRNWESRVLKRINVIEKTNFVNKTNNISFSVEDSRKGSLNRKITEKMIENGRALGLENRGKKLSEITKKKISESLIGNKYKKGKQETNETKLKKSLSKLGKPSNAKGNIQPKCSCLFCKRELTSSTIKQHCLFHHS